MCIDNLEDKIGFMQGRLSPLINGKIQAFPWEYWRNEFDLAERNGFRLIEWTLDQERLYENPLMTTSGRKEIKGLMEKHGVAVPSLTGDCFMQSPFYKVSGKQRDRLLNDLVSIIEASAALGINNILMPLVDNGRLEDEQQVKALLQGLGDIIPSLEKTGVMLTFESDLSPGLLLNFINKFDPTLFGITYDIGNSASLGFSFEDEIEAYGHRITNVHVKDRVLGGNTVCLGMGDADIPGVLRMLHQCGYTGNFILQTARASNGDHAGVLCKYRDMIVNWFEKKEDKSWT